MQTLLCFIKCFGQSRLSKLAFRLVGQQTSLPEHISQEVCFEERQTIKLTVLVNLPSQVHPAKMQVGITHDSENCASLRQKLCFFLKADQRTGNGHLLRGYFRQNALSGGILDQLLNSGSSAHLLALSLVETSSQAGMSPRAPLCKTLKASGRCGGFLLHENFRFLTSKGTCNCNVGI